MTQILSNIWSNAEGLWNQYFNPEANETDESKAAEATKPQAQTEQEAAEQTETKAADASSNPTSNEVPSPVAGDVAAEAPKLTDLDSLPLDPSQSGEVVIQPTGEYATIDVAASTEAFEILTKKTPATSAELDAVAQRVEENLGDYNPFAIIGLGSYYLDKGDLDKFGLYTRFALFRLVVDIKLAKDPSVESIIEIVQDLIATIIKEVYLSKGGTANQALEALYKAVNQVISLDKATPRNYDARWPSLHSIGAFSNAPLAKLTKEEVEKIIEQERADFIQTAKEEGHWVED